MGGADNCGLPVGISALACAIAARLEDTDDLLLLAAVLTQLGDTLNTIAATRALTGGCGGSGPAAPGSR